MAEDVEVADGVTELPGVAEALADGEPVEEAELLAEGDAEPEAGDAETEVSPVPASGVSESEVHPAAVSSRAAAVSAISGFFMGIRILWEVRIWSPV